MASAVALLFTMTLYYYTTAGIQLVKKAHLTPNQIINNGVSIMQSITVQNRVGQHGYNWVVAKESSERGWHFILSIDDTFAFDQDGISSISITMNGPANTNVEMLYFGFTTSYNQAKDEYIALEVPMTQFVGPTGFHFWTKTYPQCGSRQLAKGFYHCMYIQHTYTNVNYAKGDVAGQIVDNRQCDLANGNCHDWGNMTPFLSPYFPLKITLKNDVGRNELMIYVNDQISFCTFKSLDFMPRFFNNGLLKIYIAANHFDFPFIVSSFDVESFTDYPTEQPTQSPTEAPTNPTNNPTESPTMKPTINPTLSPTDPTSHPSVAPSRYPTNNPTHSPSPSPTDNPTPSPTSNPSLSPSNHPTNDPTYYPTNVPTRSPSGDPTSDPTHHPSWDPTNDPSVNPTQFPTPSPTNHPSFAPTDIPTQSPSNAPSSSPTKVPTDYPTESTQNPTSAPTASPTDIPTQFPTETTDGPTISPTNLPSQSTSNPTNQPTQSPVITTRPDIGSILDEINENEQEEDKGNVWVVAAIIFAGLFVLTCCCAFAVCCELACGPFGFRKVLTNESFSIAE